MGFNILDTGAAFSLYVSGGVEALDTLTKSGARVFVTQDVFDEMTSVPEGGKLSDTQKGVRDWVLNSADVEIKDVDVTEADAQKYLRGFQSGQNFDAGDVSIMKFADERVGNGNAYHIITDNYKDFDTLPSILQNKHGFSPDVSVTPSTYGYLSELFYAGEIDSPDSKKSYKYETLIDVLRDDSMTAQSSARPRTFLAAILATVSSKQSRKYAQQTARL